MQTGGYRHTEEDFAYAFKKWLVNMVVCWVRLMSPTSLSWFS